MYFNRNLEHKILSLIDKPEILAIVGPPQVGKTTLVNHILLDFENVKKITFEDIEIKVLFENDIKSFVKLYVEPYDFVFIDEIQYAKNSGKQLKYIYDTTKTKLIISGSSSIDISIRSLKFLVGRIFVLQLFPFSFSEFLQAKNNRLYELYNSKDFGEEILNELNRYLSEFILYGGYPRVIISSNEEEKKLVLKNIFNTLLLREVKDIYGIMNSNGLLKLNKLLSFQIGNLINYSELTDATGLKYKELIEYFTILEQLMIIRRCLSFSTNPRTEIVKSQKIYFIDTGLRNAIINNFSVERNDWGALYENVFFSEYLKKNIELKYWRTKSGAEVDFVWNKFPIEIKSSGKISRSLHSFIKKYKPEFSKVISISTERTEVKNENKIKIRPLVKEI